MSEAGNFGFFGSLRFRYGLGFLVLLAVAGFFLWEEHEAHIMGYLPLILILGLCVGMHFFMHGGHGGRGGHGGHGGHEGRGGRADAGSGEDGPDGDGREGAP